MIKSHNPYAKALDGLDIPNPVKSFFDFCIEREKIRKKRENKVKSNSNGINQKPKKSY